MSDKNQRLVGIVDDDLDIVQLFYDALSTITGIVRYKFTDPLMALEHIKINKNVYVLLVTDLRMPALDGIELIKKTEFEPQN